MTDLIFLDLYVKALKGPSFVTVFDMFEAACSLDIHKLTAIFVL